MGDMAQRTPTGVALLDEDPELGAALEPDELEHARRLVVVPALTREPGPWDLAADAPEPALGLLLLDGLVTVNVVLGDRVASQLAGPGDVLHETGVSDVLLPADVAHFVSERSRMAVLDHRFIAAIRRWPELMLALDERLRVQERRLAVHAAIGKLRRVEDRILALLWHLAERWGRMTPNGIVVPLALTHETIGRLAGAERPTVSLALAELSRTGDVSRRDDGAFVLREGSQSRMVPHADTAPQLRPLSVVRTPDAPRLPDAQPDRRPVLVDRQTLNKRLVILREGLEDRARESEAIVAAARASAESSAQLRARLEAERVERGRP